MKKLVTVLVLALAGASSCRTSPRPDRSPDPSSSTFLADPVPTPSSKAPPIPEAPAPRPNTTTAASLVIDADTVANLILDGRPLGRTPLRVPVEPGQHTVVLIAGSERQVRVVRVVEGQTVEVRVVFARP